MTVDICVVIKSLCPYFFSQYLRNRNGVTMKGQDTDQGYRQVGRHAFIFPRENGKGESSTTTIIASPVPADKEHDLPKEFTNYMRALFGILDEHNTGYVKLADIQSYLDVKEGQGGLPAGILESLYKVTPRNGLLDFESLCNGFKLAIRSRRSKPISPTTRKSHSMTNLNEYKDWTSDSSEDSFRIRDGSERSDLVDKWRRWRGESLTDVRDAPSGMSSPGMGQRRNSTTKVYFVGNEEQERVSSTSGSEKDFEGLKGGSSDVSEKFDKDSRLKQIAEEHDILRSGMEVIERARKWYFKRITAVQEEKLHLEQPDCKLSLEQMQYEMLLHKTRRAELKLDARTFANYKSNILHLNEYLSKVLESPLKKHGQIDFAAQVESTKQEITALKQQLEEKEQQIAQLEKEKTALIKDLFIAKSEPVKPVKPAKPVKAVSSLKVSLR